ncbi:MAG: cation:proton antiporter [Magnetococcales bacterium]|nr:cation:proton antiporter [Magnetococcales bacterium]
MPAHSSGEYADFLVTLAMLLFLGLLSDFYSQRLHVPRVTLLLLLGVLVGPSGVAALTTSDLEWLRMIAQFTPPLVVFLAGGRLTRSLFRQYQQLLVWVSGAIVASVLSVVWTGLSLLEVPIAIALTLAAIATSTAPAAITDIIRENRADGPFTRIIIGVVATNITLALALFSLLMAVVNTLVNLNDDMLPHLLAGIWEIAGSVLIGMLCGWLLTQLLKLFRQRDIVMILTLAVFFLCAGVAVTLHTSTLLATLVFGIVTNRSPDSPVAFQAIESIILLPLVILFIFAGATLHPAGLLTTGWIGMAFILLRICGMLLGGWIGTGLCEEVHLFHRRWLGPALLPQASVTLGMAMAATEAMPVLAPVVLPVVIGSIIIFETFGPIITRIALVRSGEVNRQQE